MISAISVRYALYVIVRVVLMFQWCILEVGVLSAFNAISVIGVNHTINVLSAFAMIVHLVRIAYYTLLVRVMFLYHIHYMDEFNFLYHFLRDSFFSSRCFILSLFEKIKSNAVIYKQRKNFRSYFHREEIMRFHKFSKTLCIIAGCIVIGTTPAYAEDKINYSEILSPGSSYDMSDLNNNASEYSWAVSGNTSSETIIGPDGTLVIGSDEEAETVTVAATSLQDAGTTNQYYIKIDPSVSKVSSTHASEVKEPAHSAKQEEVKKEKKEEIDYSKLNQVISSYKNLDTSSCHEADIKRMDAYVDTAKELKGLDNVSQDQIDACANRLSYAYSVLEQEAYNALPFYERYMTQLIVGAVAAVGVVILLIFMLKILRKTKIEQDPEYAAKVHAQKEQKRRQKNAKNRGPQKKRKDSPSFTASPENSKPVYHANHSANTENMYQTQDEHEQQWSGSSSGLYPEDGDAGEEATTLLEEEGEETSLLTSGMTGVLVSQKTNEEFYITKPETVIGKERKKVDICIANDPTISRRHCCITIQNDQFYLSDMGSSNGTYFGGKKLVPQQPVKLQDGDRFTISDQTFLFHINEG